MEHLVRHLLPKNIQLCQLASQAGSDDPEVPYEDSESVSGDDDESFLNNPSKLEFPQSCEDQGYG